MTRNLRYIAWPSKYRNRTYVPLFMCNYLPRSILEFDGLKRRCVLKILILVMNVEGWVECLWSKVTCGHECCIFDIYSIKDFLSISWCWKVGGHLCWWIAIIKRKYNCLSYGVVTSNLICKLLIAYCSLIKTRSLTGYMKPQGTA